MFVTKGDEIVGVYDEKHELFVTFGKRARAVKRGNTIAMFNGSETDFYGDGKYAGSVGGEIAFKMFEKLPMNAVPKALHGEKIVLFPGAEIFISDFDMLPETRVRFLSTRKKTVKKLDDVIPKWATRKTWKIIETASLIARADGEITAPLGSIEIGGVKIWGSFRNGELWSTRCIKHMTDEVILDGKTRRELAEQIGYPCPIVKSPFGEIGILHSKNGKKKYYVIADKKLYLSR